MYHYVVKKKIVLLSVLFLAAICLSDCKKNMNHAKTIQNEIEQHLFVDNRSGTALMPEKLQGESLTVIDEQFMPEVNVRNDSVHVKIQNEEEYAVFISQLEEFGDCTMLYLDLSETDTSIYLDEILAYNNYLYLNIKSGGVISAKNFDVLKHCDLRYIELNHIFAVEKNMLSCLHELDTVMIRLDSRYKGDLPTREMLYDMDCTNIMMLWEYGETGSLMEETLEGFGEWDYFCSLLSEESRSLRGVYRLNSGKYSYTSYEFYNNFSVSEAASAAFICIKDRESGGDGYYDILRIPSEKLSNIHRLDGQRIYLREDINFDGYNDLLFVGYNSSAEVYRDCIGFLWNETEKRYELNATVPEEFERVETERERLTNSTHSAFRDDYYIYEYRDDVYEEKHLEVTFSEEKILWNYYENGELTESLELLHYKNNWEIIFNGNGMSEKEILEGDVYYIDIGKRYFPEFDFYNVG